MRRAAAVALVAVLAAGCGEPPVDLALPEREPGQVLLDAAGILSPDVEERLRAASAEGTDVVGITYETEQVSRGEANRAGQMVIADWGADIVLVAVARPGDFASTVDDREDPADRQRAFGLEAANPYAVPRDVREEIAEVIVPELAARNDWDAVFTAALDELEAASATSGETPSR